MVFVEPPAITEKVDIIDFSEKKQVVDSSSSFDTLQDERSIDGYDSSLEWTKEEESRVVRKIDFALFPFVLLMTFVLNMDRTNISNAISDNLPADLGFGMTGVNSGTLVYSVTFTIVTIITPPIVKRVGAHYYIPFLMFSWAIVTWCHAFLTNHSGFLAIRFFIALTEAGFIPSCLTYLTQWYKTDELATRLSWFWGVQSFASAFSGLISFGIFRMGGVAGLSGWKWLFIIDGILTQIISVISLFFIPSGPANTKGYLRGKSGWFNEHDRKIAVTRIIRDDLSKISQNKPVTWHDVKISLLDSKLWTHLLITFTSMMPITPITTYLPTLIKGYGFSVTTSNLLSVPAPIIGLVISVLVAHSADKRGNYAFHALFGCLWSLIGFLVLEFLPNSAGRWSFYGAALFVGAFPIWHGMHIAWMSSNLAPAGKRNLALGTIIGFANLCSMPGSQIYQEDDAPRFYRGNWVNFSMIAVAAVLLIFQHIRYTTTNKIREKKWNSLTDAEKKDYLNNTTDEGSNRLDYRFRI